MKYFPKNAFVEEIFPKSSSGLFCAMVVNGILALPRRCFDERLCTSVASVSYFNTLVNTATLEKTNKKKNDLKYVEWVKIYQIDHRFSKYLIDGKRPRQLIIV